MNFISFVYIFMIFEQIVASKNELKKQKFQSLTQSAKREIDRQNFSGAQDLLEEALALKPSSLRTANDLGVVLLQWANDDLDEGIHFEARNVP